MDNQRSDEWFESRIGRITGSRIGAILEVNPWQSRADVMRAMVREYHKAPSEFEGNIATNWGNNHEDEAILDFELETGLIVDKTGFHKYENWAGASPDGLIGDDAILEVKCPYGLRNDENPQFKPLSDQPHYYAQTQWEMMCSKRSKAYFRQWTTHGTKLEQVDIDHGYLETAVYFAKIFRQEYIRELDNPEHLEPLRKEVNTNRSKMLIDEYDQLKDAIYMAQERQKEVLDELIDIGGGVNCEIWGRKLTQVNRKGSVSYAKAVKDLLPDADLTPYTGKDSSYWKLS